jgi:hypothetical protein
MMLVRSRCWWDHYAETSERYCSCMASSGAAVYLNLPPWAGKPHCSASGYVLTPLVQHGHLQRRNQGVRS